MDKDERRSPEELLSAIQREERESGKGHLKIFLGMCAGVGKTYAMLEEARELASKSIDVVLGVVDTHERRETALLLQGLKTIPEKLVEYKGKEFKELDVDAVISTQPYLVLIDELAHSNIPGLRHAKRWQDVLEILDHGINVYTTLNVQHIESLNDVIGRIADTSVRETVPDLIVEKATSIQLIDLTPDELLQRLKEGKVYLGEQSKIAPMYFFQKDRLAALREIVLRYAAEKVDRDLWYSLPSNEQVIKWKPREKILIAINHSPHSQQLIRTARRLAANIKAPWVAVHVNNGLSLDEKEANQLIQNLQLAQDLGAELVSINDPDIVGGIQRIARKKGITQIILGRTPTKKLGFFSKPTLLDRLSAENSDIDLHVIGQQPLHLLSKGPKSLFEKFSKKFFSFPLRQLSPYIIVFLCVALLTGLNWIFLPWIGYKIVGVLFLIAILGFSLFFKKGPIFFASILYALIWSIFFIPPAGQVIVSPYEDIGLLTLYVLTAIANGILVDRAREQKEMLEKNEDSAQFLYDISLQIAKAQSLQEIFKLAKNQLQKRFNCNIEILAKQIDDGLMLEGSIQLLVDDKIEQATAVWSFENAKEAGWSTANSPSAKNLYIPLKGFYEVVGVFILQPKTKKFLTVDEKAFLYNICRQLAICIEHSYSEEKNRKHEQLEQLEGIHKTILNRLSHEFQKPLIDAKESVSKLKNKLTLINSEEAFNAAVEVEKSLEIFNRILSNISAMAQLSEGIIPLSKNIHSVAELIEECCDNVKVSKNGHTIKIICGEDLPFIPFDYYLIYMLIYNLLINALDYSPPNSTITVEAKRNNGFLVLSVSDEGKGIPEDKLDVVFEKFYRLPEATAPGIGLGLAISKTIAEAHHGYLIAENLPSRGAKFSLFLPVEETTYKSR